MFFENSFCKLHLWKASSNIKSVLTLRSFWTQTHFQESSCNWVIFDEVAETSLPKVGLHYRCFQISFVKLSYQLFYKTPMKICFCGRIRIISYELSLPQTSEGYSKLCQTSKMECLARLHAVAYFRKSSILDVWQLMNTSL